MMNEDRAEIRDLALYYTRSNIGVVLVTTVDGKCKGNLTDLRRELHLSLAKGNPKRTL
jgi:hypothetical protein